jgi:uncharacterized BrkB/YihY/UPF0761 family membrane protein
MTPETFQALVEMERATAGHMVWVCRGWLIASLLVTLFGVVYSVRSDRKHDIEHAGFGVIIAAMGTVFASMVAVTMIEYMVKRDHPEASLRQRMAAAERMKR